MKCPDCKKNLSDIEIIEMEVYPPYPLRALFGSWYEIAKVRRCVKDGYLRIIDIVCYGLKQIGSDNMKKIMELNKWIIYKLSLNRLNWTNSYFIAFKEGWNPKESSSLEEIITDIQKYG